MRCRIGTKLALQNLRAGAGPTQSGHDNAHYFDDIATVRALAAVAVLPSGEAAEGAVADASVTHSLDGVWCAQAAAVLFTAALRHRPGARRMRRPPSPLRRAPPALSTARRLSTRGGDWIYSYPIAAPETFGFLLTHVSRARAPTTCSSAPRRLGASPRNTASLPALAGAAATAMFGENWIPGGLAASELRLTGLAIPTFAGRTVAEVVGA